MGKIILIIYVIAAVASIISKQKKKKKLLEGSQTTPRRQGRPPIPLEEKNEASKKIARAELPHREIFEKRNQPKDRKRNQGFKDSETAEEAGEKPKPGAKQIAKGKDIFLEIAKEFGLVLDPPPSGPKPGTNPHTQVGQPAEVLTGESPFVWEEPADLEEGVDTDENTETPLFEPPIERFPELAKGMGLTQREPHLPPSLAYTPNLSKKAQRKLQLKDRESFKNAFILKTILDAPIALKHQIRR